MIGRHRGKTYSGRYLADLYARQNSLCWWCKSQTVLRRFIPDADVVSFTGGRVTWREAGLVLTARVASLDHVEPKRDGPHAHDPINFVLACIECNTNRTKTPSPVPDAIRRVCPDCLGPKDRHFRYCVACRRRRVEDWLTGTGWLKEPSHEQGYFVWRDPTTGETHIQTRAVKIQRERSGKPTCDEPAA